MKGQNLDVPCPKVPDSNPRSVMHIHLFYEKNFAQVSQVLEGIDMLISANSVFFLNKLIIETPGELFTCELTN